MTDLVSGSNVPLPDSGLVLAVPGPFDLSALVTGDHGKVAGDADFVFYNQPSAPGVRLVRGTITVEPRRLRAGASRVTVVVSPADSGTPLGRLPVPALTVTRLPDAAVVARFTPPRPAQETVLLLVEIYRRGPAWKLRALGQGYADGLAGVARDFGIEVAEDRPPSGVPPAVPAPPGGGRGGGGSRSARRPPVLDPSGGDRFTSLVNAERARAGAPPVTTEARLSAAAQAHAAVMAQQAALSTEGPEGTSVYQRITACGYTYLALAEQLVSGPRSPDEFLDYCRSAEDTRRPVTDPAFTDVGIGHAVGPRSGDVYWTALWARPFSTEGLARTVSEVLALTNAERAAAGLAPLAHESRLAAAAQAHSADMIARDFYSHTSPEGHQPWDRARAAGSTHHGIGENIACGQRSPAEVVLGWMNSPGHRANILKPGFRHLGVGFAGGGRTGTYWTQLFGQP